MEAAATHSYSKEDKMEKEKAITEQVDLTDRKEHVDKALKELQEDDKIVFCHLPDDLDKHLKSYCRNLLSQEKTNLDISLEEVTLYLDTLAETERDCQEQVRREKVSISQ